MIGFGLGWGFELLATWLWGAAPTVAWTAPAVLAALAVLVGVKAWQTHRQLHVRGERIEARRAFNLVLLAKASALVGAAVVGGYAGFAVPFLDQWSAPLPRERVVASLLCVVAGVAVTVGAKALEHACRLPDDPRDDDLGRA